MKSEEIWNFGGCLHENFSNKFNFGSIQLHTLYENQVEFYRLIQNSLSYKKSMHVK